jgi:hypothetical protein
VLRLDPDRSDTYGGGEMNPDLKFPLVDVPEGLQFFMFKRADTIAMNAVPVFEKNTNGACGCGHCSCGQSAEYA